MHVGILSFATEITFQIFMQEERMDSRREGRKHDEHSP